MHLLLTDLLAWPGEQRIRSVLLDWREDSANFLRHDVPKLVLIIIAVVVLIRILRASTRGMLALRTRRLPPGIRAQQIHTLASVITSIGTFAIVFVAALQALSIVGLNLGPLLASAGIAGLAIGFGAQTLVHDFINGFFVLLEDQYNIGDTIRVAGVKGAVEDMTLRRTVLRDDDGTLHIIPNSQITLVSNMTRDWAQIAMKVVVAYGEPSEKIVSLLQQVGNDIRHDPAFADDIVSDVQVPGIDRVGNGEAEYLLLLKTKPNKQYGVSRELRRRIKECFDKNNVQTAAPGRVYVRDMGTDGKS
jgi:moderate conductance mechanosensitive channel